jgi:hypothetical protein
MGFDLVGLRPEKAGSLVSPWHRNFVNVSLAGKHDLKLGDLLGTRYSLLATHVHKEGQLLHDSVRLSKSGGAKRIVIGTRQWLEAGGQFYFRDTSKGEGSSAED